MVIKNLKIVNRQTISLSACLLHVAILLSDSLNFKQERKYKLKRISG